MSLRLRQPLPENEPRPPGADAAPSSATPPQAALPAPSISGWLGVLSTMLPRRQAESVREELETHLRERVRDLMVGGLNEGEATRRAIAELGEAAELAAKYRAVTSEPRRRMAMYGSIFAVAGAALALSVASISRKSQPESELAKAKAENEVVKNFLASALTQGEPQGNTGLLVELLAQARPSQPENPAAAATVLQLGRYLRAAAEYQPAAPALDALTMDVHFENSAAKDVVEAVSKKAEMPVQADWGKLGEVGLPPDARVTMRAKGATADMILRALNEAAGHVREAKIDWRSANGVIEIAPREHFDKREVKLVIYDLDGIIAARQAKYAEDRSKIVEEIVQLVCEFVSPEGWQDNGGDLAKMTVVGDRMFVEAPERFHKQIRWMLDQLPDQNNEKPRKEGNAGDIQRYPLRHIDAVEALNALKKNLAIKAIDFTDFFVDSRTNSVIGKVTADQHIMVESVLGQIDTEEAALKTRKRSEDLRKLHELDPQIQKIARDKAGLEAALRANDLDAAQRDRMNDALKALTEMEAAKRLEAEQLRNQISQGLGQQPAVVYLSGTGCPGVYSLTEGLTLRRLLASAGGLPPGTREVVISESANGQITTGLSVSAEALSIPTGQDPELKPGQLVSVR